MRAAGEYSDDFTRRRVDASVWQGQKEAARGAPAGIGYLQLLLRALFRASLLGAAAFRDVRSTKEAQCGLTKPRWPASEL